MKVPDEIVEARMKAFRAICDRQGLKVTHQRTEIFRELACTEAHPDAEAIFTRVRKRIPSISLDTVYRNLKTLSEHGVVSVVGTDHERLRFDANMDAHHHFVCVKCGSIHDFYSEALASVSSPREVEPLGSAVSLHIEVKGVCTACGRKNG